MHIEETVTITKAEYDSLKREIVELKILVAQLMQEIQLLRNGRNSGKSHTPPSHQFTSSNSRSLREKSDKKTGGQDGHEGNTLLMKAVADKVINHVPNYCNCGADLTDIVAELSAIKQEIGLPEIRAEYIEHRTFSKSCNCCGKKMTAAMPVHLKAPIQYGAGIGAMVGYLHTYQYIPYHRMCKLFKDLFQMKISEGSIKNILEKLHNRAIPAYNEIGHRIENSDVVGGDETGIKINNQKGWIHTWQNSMYTFTVASYNRGYQTVQQYFSNGFLSAVYVSDCWAAQLKVKAKVHQLCLAHLLRELNNFEDALGCQWSTELKLVLKKAIAMKKELTADEYRKPPTKVIEIQEELFKILDVEYDAKHKKIKAFIKRLVKNKNSIFPFLYYQNVPSDNNGSERAIRNIKVKNKVSGCFRSKAGADFFAVIRSVIDTAIKNGQDVFSALYTINSVVPE